MIIQDLEKDHTLVTYKQPPVGPFDNQVGRDLKYYYKLKGYNAGLPAAAALAKAEPSQPTTIQGYYPTTNHITNSLEHGGCRSTDDGLKHGDIGGIWANVKFPLWTYLWVIIKAPGHTDEYQLRFHPESWNEDGFNGERPNHSFLTEGWRVSALFGYPDMQCYGAGKFHTDFDGKIVAMDTQSGHYYSGFKGKDKQVFEFFKDFLSKLGYQSGNIKYLLR